MTPTTDTPANPPLRLRAGGYYRTRGDLRVGPLRPWGHDEKYIWTEDEGGYLYNDRGVCWGTSYESSATLIEEWAEPITPAPTPVQTHTTVRTVIVPGEYGRVAVEHPSAAPDRVSIAFDREIGTGGEWYIMGATELRAAAATLTQLADGLDAIAAERNESK